MEQSLCIATVVFKSVAERAAADDLESGRPQFVLAGSALLGDILKNYVTISARFSDPRKLRFPIVHARSETRKSALTKGFRDENANFVTFGL